MHRYLFAYGRTAPIYFVLGDGRKEYGADITSGMGGIHHLSQVRSKSISRPFSLSTVLVSLFTSRISYVSQLALAINDLEELLFHSKASIKSTANLKKDQDYDRTLYLSYESNPKAAFRSLYQFTFALAKPELVPLIALPLTSTHSYYLLACY